MLRGGLCGELVPNVLILDYKNCQPFSFEQLTQTVKLKLTLSSLAENAIDVSKDAFMMVFKPDENHKVC